MFPPPCYSTKSLESYSDFLWLIKRSCKFLWKSRNLRTSLHLILSSHPNHSRSIIKCTEIKLPLFWFIWLNSIFNIFPLTPQKTFAHSSLRVKLFNLIFIHLFIESAHVWVCVCKDGWRSSKQRKKVKK